jgi:hypothetical protein
MPEDERLLGGEEEVWDIGGVLAALAEEGRGAAEGVGHPGHEVTAVAGI